MGVRPSKENFGGNFAITDWTQIEDRAVTQNKLEQGQFRYLKNMVSGQQLQEYHFSFSSQEDFNTYLSCFKWRLSEQDIVNTKYLMNEKINELCATRNTCTVYIEHMPWRLSDITDIPFPENLYVIKACLRGFQKLFINIGYFKIEEDFICVDRFGKVRVWFNSDLSKNYPSVEDVFDSTAAALQNKMVRQIIQLIDNSTDHETECPMTFLQYLNKNTKRSESTFKETRIFLEQYARSVKVLIPNVFQSMIEIMKQENSIQDSNRTESGYIERMVPQSDMEIISLPKPSHQPTQNNNGYPSHRNGIDSRISNGFDSHQYSRITENNGFRLNRVDHSHEHNHHNNTSGINHWSRSSKNGSFYGQGCLHPKVSFSYSNSNQSREGKFNFVRSQQPDLNEQQAEQIERYIQQQEIYPSNEAFQVLSRQKQRNFRMKSLIQQCQEDLEMSNRIYKVSSVEQFEELHQRSLGKSKSKERTVSKKMAPGFSSIAERNEEDGVMENNRNQPRSPNSRKNFYMLNNHEQHIYRSQNSPTSLKRKNKNAQITWSQINFKKPQIQKNKSVQNDGEMEKDSQAAPYNHFHIDQQENLTELNSKTNYAYNSRHYTRGSQDLDERNSNGLQMQNRMYSNANLLEVIPELQLDPQIARDLKLYQF